jgi:hypothetical protein
MIEAREMDVNGITKQKEQQSSQAAMSLSLISVPYLVVCSESTAKMWK